MPAKNYRTPETIKKYAVQMAKVMTDFLDVGAILFEPVVRGERVFFINSLTGNTWYYMWVDELLNAETNFSQKISHLISVEGGIAPLTK